VGLTTWLEATLGSLGRLREEEGFALRVFVGGLQGDEGGFGVILERAIGEAARRRKGEEMRVRKVERLNRREGDRRTRGGSQRKGLETLNAEKKKQSRENIPQHMHQTVNG